MQASLWSAAIPVLLLLGGCQENSVPQDGTQSGSGSTESVPAGGNPGDEQPPADQPEQEQNGGSGGTGSDPDPIGSEDGPYTLAQPAVTTLRYSGPAEDHLHVDVAESSATGEEVVPAGDLWQKCFQLHVEERSDWCNGDRLRESWGDIGDAVDTLDEDVYDDQDIVAGDSELRFSDRGVDYGDLSIRTRILDLPSTRYSAQVSRLVTLSAEWKGYPGYLMLETGLPDGNSTVSLGKMTTGALIRIYGEEDPNSDWSDRHKRSRVKPQLLVEKELGDSGKYYFRLPADSPYWQMDSPVRFTLEVSQWTTVTREP